MLDMGLYNKNLQVVGIEIFNSTTSFQVMFCKDPEW